MKKLSKTKAELKRNAAYKKKRVFDIFPCGFKSLPSRNSYCNTSITSIEILFTVG